MINNRIDNIQRQLTRLEQNFYILKEKFNNYHPQLPSLEMDLGMKMIPNKTHIALVEDDIKNYHIGEPVFLTGNMYQLNDEEKYVKATVNNKNECICGVIKGNDINYRLFLGICSSINEENNTIEYMNQGCYYFKVNNSNNYKIGNTLLYNGEIIDDSKVFITREIERQIIGIITGIIDDNYVSVFK